MAAKTQEKALVVCPHCGHQQSEARAAISTNCRQCGKYLRLEELRRPVAKTAALAVAQHRHACFDCGTEIDVPAAAQSAMCKRCSSYLDLKDYTITNAVSKNFKTKGRFVVELKGYVFNTSVVAREIVLRGQVIGKLAAEESLTWYSTAEIKGTFQTRKLIVPAENSFHTKETLRVGGAEIGGEFVGPIVAENSLLVRATGRIFGDVEARHLIVEAGAILVGRMKVGGPPPNGQ